MFNLVFNCSGRFIWLHSVGSGFKANNRLMNWDIVPNLVSEMVIPHSNKKFVNSDPKIDMYTRDENQTKSNNRKEYW